MESLESAADSVRAAGDLGAAAIGDLAEEAGSKLDSAAAYVRDFDQAGLFTAVKHTVRRYPMGSLALAAAVGLAAGFSFRRSGPAC